jgi:hypothetical protein
MIEGLGRDVPGVSVPELQAIRPKQGELVEREWWTVQHRGNSFGLGERILAGTPAVGCEFKIQTSSVLQGEHGRGKGGEG